MDTKQSDGDAPPAETIEPTINIPTPKKIASNELKLYRKEKSFGKSKKFRNVYR